MAFITLSGTLLDPNGDLAVGDQIRFTHKSTTGETVQSAVSIITINPTGTYSLPLQYGLVLVEYKDVRTQQFKNLGVATVNQDNPATSIPELLNALVPVSSAELIEFQAILADCVTAQTAAENSATTAEAFAYQLTTTDLIASTATFTAETSIPTSGFTDSGDGCNGSWKQTGLTGQTPSQSPAQLGGALLNDGNGNQWGLIREGNNIELSKLGAKQGDDISSIFAAAVSEIGGDEGLILLPYAPESNPCFISSEQTIRSSTVVQGITRDKSWIKVPDNTGLSIFRVTNRTNVAFLNFSVDGNSANQTSGQIINISNTDGIWIDNIMVKNPHSAYLLIDTGSKNINIGTIENIGGGEGASSRGLSLSNTSDVQIGRVISREYTGAVVNVSDSADVSIGQILASRDYATLGWTSGKAALRLTNESINVTCDSLMSDGFSRGLFVLTGSKEVTVSKVHIKNCETQGIFVEGDNLSASEPTGSATVAVSGGIILNTDIGGGGQPAVLLSSTSKCKISNLHIQGDINEITAGVTITSNNNIITSNTVTGAINTVGSNTISSNNIVGV